MSNKVIKLLALFCFFSSQSKSFAADKVLFTEESLFFQLYELDDAEVSNQLISSNQFVTLVRVSSSSVSISCDFGFPLNEDAFESKKVITEYQCFFKDEQRCELKLDLNTVETLFAVKLPTPRDCGLFEGQGAIGVGTLSIGVDTKEPVDLKPILDEAAELFPRIINIDLSLQVLKLR